MEGQESRQKLALEAQARSALVASPYACVRTVACLLRNGVLTLHGQVPSYFHKQVAQTVVLQRLNRSIPIDNQLRVVTRVS
jgi:hypothetical protein